MGIGIDGFYVRAENDLFLVWVSIEFVFALVVEIDLISLWEINLGLISV